MPSAKFKRTEDYEVPAELREFFDAFVDLLVAAYLNENVTGDEHDPEQTDAQQHRLPADQ